MHNNKVIVWTQGIDNLLGTSKKTMIGGITVQMAMWSKVFLMNDWTVFSFTKNKLNNKKILDGINYFYYPSIQYVNPLISLLYGFYIVIKLRPDLILLRGATRDLFFLNILAKIYRIKIVSFFASNSDLEKGNELIKRKLERLLYRYGIKMTQYLIVQNHYQSSMLKSLYKKESIIIPNIWLKKDIDEELHSKRELILWVSNFRELKRPEWFIELAKLMPNQKFTMVGGPNDNKLYERCKNICSTIDNVNFLGPLSFEDTNRLFNKTKIFVCTSKIEGFPNTFLQAWCNKIPIVSTYDPSNILQLHSLGLFCETVNEIKSGVEKILNDNNYYIFQKNIEDYFVNSHSPQLFYNNLINMLNIA